MLSTRHFTPVKRPTRTTVRPRRNSMFPSTRPVNRRLWALLLGSFTALPAYQVVARGDPDRPEGNAAVDFEGKSWSYQEVDVAKAKLKLVQVIFRHGARSPLSDARHLWKGNEWDVCGPAYQSVPLDVRGLHGGPPPESQSNQQQMSTILEGGCHKGELTRLGQQQALSLGQWLKRTYVDLHGLLPPSYQPGLVQGRCTNFQRTRATLQGVLTGLYPQHRGPVPVTTSTDVDEIMYADTRTCPHLLDLMRAAKAQLTEQSSQDLRLPSVKARLQQVLQLPPGFFEGRHHFSDIYDVMTSLAAHGKPLPAGMDPELLEVVDELATREFSAFMAPSIKDAHGKVVLRLSMGRLLDTLLSNMEQAARMSGAPADLSWTEAPSKEVESHQGPLMHLYSGHDSTIMPLLAALGVEITRWPPYLSNLVFELWHMEDARDTTGGNKGVYLVRVLYNQEELTLPGCPEGASVTLNCFRDHVLRPFILSHEDHSRSCTAPLAHDSPLPLPTKGISSPQELSDI